jgi:4-carboxymuconolactone decarboxylase
MTTPPKVMDAMKMVAPKLAEVTEHVVFGDIWQRVELSPRDRSLITIAALIAMHRPTSLKPHIKRGLKNGLTKAEISEMITHLAVYAGWPSSVVACEVAAEIFLDEPPSA